ncbi:MAG TPA: diguanylate cyclase [Vicinamibacterales bacterium]|nr:diguanylate cyclase [Vicinamibacterales bacterium]
MTDRPEYEAWFDGSLIGVAQVRDGRFVRVNEEFARIYGDSPQKWVGASAGPLAPDTAPASIESVAPTRTSYHREHMRPDGQRRTLLVEAITVASPDRTDKTNPPASTDTLYTVVDVTEREQNAAALENARALLMRAVDSMSDGFVVFGPDDRILLCNQVYAATLDGFGAASSLIGMHVETIIRHQIAQGQPMPAGFTGDIDQWVAHRLALHRRADGIPHVQQLSDGRWVQSTRHRMPDGGIVVLRSDITAFKESERAAHVLAHHDALTGLPNRRLLKDRLALAAARSTRRGAEMVAVLVIDLDRFKPINDAHGHRAGDEVLRVIANRLVACLRSADTVARLGGDEFVVVLDGVAAACDVDAVALKIIEAASRPIPATWAAAGTPPDVQVGCSIGISLCPRDGVDMDRLIGLADTAMYHAKEAGRGRFAHQPAAVSPQTGYDSSA